MPRTTPQRLPIFGLMVALCLSPWGGRHMVLAALQNVTIDDSSPSIIFTPSSAWHNSSDLCSSCLSVSPTLAANASFNQAVNPDDGPIDDPDFGSDSNPTVAPVANANANPGPAASSLPVAPAAIPPPPAATPVAASEDAVAHEHGGHDGAPSKRRVQSGKRRSLVNRVDPGDPAFVSVPITMQFNFTGNAIYLFGIQPNGPPPNVTATTTNTNLTFTIDGQTVGQNVSSSSSSQTTLVFQPNTLVYQNTNISDGPHNLVVTVGANSVFIFDYLIYTTNTSAPGTISAGTSVDTSKKHNTETFAAAVGGSVGVLSLVALGLALSIIRRRQLSARRDRLPDGDSLHTNGSEDSPHMIGPAPFIPRYFPGTRLPTDPPPYIPSLSTHTRSHTRNYLLPHGQHSRTQSIQSSDEDGLNGPYRGRVTHPRDRSYADIPPSSTPPPPDTPLDDLTMEFTPPPPPFGVAIATPSPISLNSGGLPPPPPPRLRLSASSPNIGSNDTTPPPPLPPPPHSVSGHGTQNQSTTSRSSSPSLTLASSGSRSRSPSPSPSAALPPPLPSTQITRLQIPQPQPQPSSSASASLEVDQVSHSPTSSPTRSLSSIISSIASGGRTTNSLSLGGSIPSSGTASTSNGTGTTAVSTQGGALSPTHLKPKKASSISSLFRVRGRGSSPPSSSNSQSSSSTPALVHPGSAPVADLPTPLPQASTSPQRLGFIRQLRRGNNNNDVGGEQGSIP